MAHHKDEDHMQDQSGGSAAKEKPEKPKPKPTRRKITLIDSPTASGDLLAELKRHLPFSIPILRRIQFAQRFPGPPGSTEFTHVLWAFYEAQDQELEERKHFAAAYLDLSRDPETQCWIYCTLEDSFSDYYYETAGDRLPHASKLPMSEQEQGLADELVLAVLRRVWEIFLLGRQQQEQQQQTQEANNDSGLDYNGAKHTVMIGSLHETVRQRLLKLGVRMFKTRNILAEIDWEFCNKWLFRVEDFPTSFRGINILSKEDGGSSEVLSLPWKNPDQKKSTDTTAATPEPTILKLRFDKVKREDISLIKSRTSIDRKPETLLALPSLVLRRVSASSAENNKEKEEPIAWAFTGLDGTLMTLHVESAYRGLGLAKLIACKIMRQSLPLYCGDSDDIDGWGAADVFVANTQSQGVCKSIGGQAWWTLSWAVVDLDSLPGLPALPA